MMRGSGKRPVARQLVVTSIVAAAAVVVGAIVSAMLLADPTPGPRASARLAAATRPARSSGGPSVAPAPAAAACGATSTATIAGVDQIAARGIYEGELHGREVSADIAHVTGSQALVSALASHNTAAVYEAVHAIVYTPHWHIVRLRVLQAGRVVADVGGPDIIAPISGTLRSRGRKVGTYVMSVQDDAGYVKLVSRFIGVPIDLYRSGSFLMGTLQPAPAKVTAGTSVVMRGTAYAVDLLRAQAFPSGNLDVALLIPKPASKLSRSSCASLRLAAWGSIAMHIAARLHPLASHYQNLVNVLQGTTGGLVYVRSGSRRLAGSADPTRLPRDGTVMYAGRTWSVFSWEAVPPARIYFLTPPA
jgi:hypothetical protein